MISISNLRQALKEYLELDDTTIEGFVSIFEDQWKALLAQQLSDEKAAEIVEILLGTPDWTKNRTR